MRLRHLALGCTLTAALGCLALSSATARAAAETLDETALAKPQLTIAATATDYQYGAMVTFTVTLGPTASNPEVSLYASPYGARNRTLVSTAAFRASGGTWHPTATITRETLYTVVYGGDSRDAATSVSIILQAYARVTDQVAGYFKTAKVGGITYDEYHGTGTLTLYSSVTPPKHSECLEPESEQLDGNTWDADTKYGCDQLDTAGHDAARSP